MVIRFSDGRDYVSAIVPLSKSTAIADAKTYDIDDSCRDDTVIENTIIDALTQLYTQTGSMNWTIYVYKEDGTTLAATIRTSATATDLNIDCGAIKEEAEFAKYLSYTVATYIPDIVIKTAFSSSLAATTSSATPTALGAEPKDKDVDKLIEEIVAKTKADISKPTETLADYMCNDMLREELEEIKDFFENESVYKDAGVSTPKGILFKGEPGTGKTYAARCLAGSTACYFMSCTASALQGMYIGSGAENIRAIFKGAKLLREKTGKGVYLFIDELDSFGNREQHSGHAGGEEDRTINQLLAEMSGFTDAEGIMILGATNYADRLDDALTRSGRFSRQITIDKPDFAERESMVKYYFNKIKLPLDDTSFDEIAHITKGLTPADIKEISNESAILTIRQKLSKIPLNNVNEAVNKVITKNIRHPDGKLDTYLVAAHEAGHVLAEVLYADSIPVKVTNYSYGDAGGFTQSGSHLEGINDKERHIAEIKMLLGGRAAEEVICSRVTNGASNDLKRAKAHLKRYFETYHFESYEVKNIDQIILDRLNELYKEVVDEYSNPEYKDILANITNTLDRNRVLYSKDIASICSAILLKGDIL